MKNGRKRAYEQGLSGLINGCVTLAELTHGPALDDLLAKPVSEGMPALAMIFTKSYKWRWLVSSIVQH